MFATRMRLAVAAVALAVVVPLVATTGAVADQPGRSTEQVAPAKKSRTVYLKGNEIRDTGRFYAYGRVVPGYAKRPVILQRKLKSEKRWSSGKRFTTNSRSKYRVRIGALSRRGTVCYRVKVPGNRSFRTSYSTRIPGKSARRVCIRTY